MAAYIDREATVESLNALKPFLRDKGQVQLLRRVMNHIGKIPAADVKPVVHGRWEPHYEHDFVSDEDVLCGLHCSLCGLYYVKRHNYCPNCGERMDG